MIRARERLLGCRGVAKMRVDRDVVRDLIPDRRGAGGERRLGVDCERERLVIDLDRLCRIERLRDGSGHDHGHRLADMARLVPGQEPVRAEKHFAAVRRGQFHVVSGRRHRLMRNRVEPGGAAVCAAVGAEHARHGARHIERDGANARMRMRRAHHRRIGLARQMEIVGEAALAGHEAQILLAPQGPADRTRA
jgi:hypothetical protein